MNYKLLLSILLFVLVKNGFAQITITHPFERMVYQRNNSNQAKINIAGNYYSAIDRVDARVVSITGGNTTAWTTIQSNPSNGYFYGTITATGGWYRLEVNAYRNNTLVDSKSIQKLGIGEVFAIAGQSNAQGGAGVSTPAEEDMVNTVNYSNNLTDYNRLPIGFSKMEGDSCKIGPFHYVPWAWGKLGDLLVRKLGVPVLFYGAGHGGTSSNDWSKSSQGLPYDGESWKRQDLGAPYRALENSVAYYGSLTGLRAVLWHQGESDPETFFLPYYENVRNVINKSRENAEHTSLAWVVARVSRNPEPHDGPILGQNTLISGFQVGGGDYYPPVPYVFAGPNTDNINGSTYRTDGIHFDTYAGQIEFANAWNSTLDNTFFTSSIPMMASALLPVSLTCNNSTPATPITLSVTGGFNKYAWSNRQNTVQESIGFNYNGCCQYTNIPPVGYENLNWRTLDSTSITTGTAARYAANVRKSSKKVFFSPVIDLSAFTLPTSPAFSSSATQVRPNDSLVLTGSNCNGTFLWSTGATTNPLTFVPSTTNSYTVQCKTLYCISAATSPQTITVSSCFPDNLNLNGTVSSAESPYSSQQSIQSNQIIQLSGKINYTAAKKVELRPGFEAKSGTVFQAMISGCN
ncbi:protein of unknown function DUF303 acetylesterase [Emticicia oligotrophica DSM 17448]|uniref:Sialate O-acetylesterase domain-containing protein n=1 Tax=Emticicia oligotrophica (strain DSM 17448 / CIP 109782 / MTCC 6937 / GPTSA100-15) TaxID=929562 RepID=A0ABM5N0Z1_EMTOG|nr:3-coathanger stack domain-containing protein [Emticicia oligotrophica]AFK03149.1 protein of unknown function DUF303 acetylesterase [Emticicia oligotrophica DSM 17448]